MNANVQCLHEIQAWCIVCNQDFIYQYDLMYMTWITWSWECMHGSWNHHAGSNLHNCFFKLDLESMHILFGCILIKVIIVVCSIHFVIIAVGQTSYSGKMTVTLLRIWSSRFCTTWQYYCIATNDIEIIIIK